MKQDTERLLDVPGNIELESAFQNIWTGRMAPGRI